MAGALAALALGAGSACAAGGTSARADAQVAQSPAPGSAGLIALTFDDGPTAMTDEILDVLADKGVQATFFVVGERAQRRPATLRRLQREGHVIGNHSWSHPNFSDLDAHQTRRQILRTNAVVRRVTGTSPVLFRYPYGDETQEGNTVIRENQMWGGVLWHWQTGAGDFTCPGPEGVVRYLNDNAVDQALLLLHDGNEVDSCSRPQMEYLPEAIDSLRARGFEFGVVASAGGPSAVNQSSWVRVIPASDTGARTGTRG